MATTKNADSLIEQLSGNFAAEGKRSCRDCLRSKAMPSQRVVGVAENEDDSLVSQPVLLEAHSITMQRLAVLKTDASSTALSLMDSVATAIRFIQLLLYLPQVSNSKLRQPLTNQSSNSPLPSVLSTDRLDLLVHALLTSLVQSTASLLSSRHADESSMNDDDADIDPMTMDASSTQTDARPVACFVFLSILRLQQFCKRRQQWMIPLCKGLCDLALTAQKVNAPLPLSLIEDAIRKMTKLLEEGTVVLTNHAASRWMTTTTTTPTNDHPSPAMLMALDHHTFFAKFLSFLVSRITTLLSLLPGENGPCYDENSPTTSLWKILTTLRGLPPVIRLCWCRNEGRSRRDADDAAFLANYTGIANKIEKQLVKVVLVSTTSTGSASAPRVVRAGLLQALLDMKVKQRKTSSNPPSSRRDSSSSPIQDLLRNGRILGRALLLQRILHKVSCDTSSTGQEILSMDDCNALLKSCETYHSVVLPQCFGLLAAAMYTGSYSHGDRTNELNGTEKDNATASPLQTFLAVGLASLTTLLLRIEKSLVAIDTAKRSQFHRLLIRWMTPTTQSQKAADGIPTGANNNAGTGMLHPMSQELVLSLMYLYILLASDKTTIPPLVTLMIKLLFDARTHTELRSNISTIILRLRASSSPPSWMPELATRIENEFAEHWKVFSASQQKKSSSSTKKKRKRKGSSNKPDAFYIYNAHDVEAIGRVLAQLPNNHSPLLRDSIQAFVHEDVLKLMGKKRVSVQLKSISLLLWYMHGDMMCGGDSSMIPASSKTSIVQSTVEHVVVQLNGSMAEKKLLNYSPLILATISLCHVLCNNVTTASSLPMLSVCQIVTACTSESFLRPPIETEEATLLQRHRILFGGISLLGSMGNALPESCSAHVLEVRFAPLGWLRSRAIFHRFFYLRLFQRQSEQPSIEYFQCRI